MRTFITHKGRIFLGPYEAAFYIGPLAIQVVRNRKRIYIDWTKRSGIVKTKRITW